MRHQAEKTRAFDGGGKFPLVRGAEAGALFRGDFHLARHERPERLRVFVVNVFLVFRAKYALLLFYHANFLCEASLSKADAAEMLENSAPAQVFGQLGIALTF